MLQRNLTNLTPNGLLIAAMKNTTQLKTSARGEFPIDAIHKQSLRNLSPWGIPHRRNS